MTDRKIRLIKRLLFLLIPYSILRLGFYFYHLNIYQQFSSREILESFLLGIRFDIAAICLLNIPVILSAMIPILKEKWDRLLFVVINTLGMIMALDDYELFLFTGKRLAFDFFVITDDIVDQLPQITLNYWYLPLIAVAMGVGLYFFDLIYLRVKTRRASVLKRFIASFLILGFVFIGIRGGLQHKSINVQSAFVQGKNELGHLVLNSPYHFLRTLKNKPKESLKYFATDDEAKSIIFSERNLADTPQLKNKANIVLIILESFSSEYMEKGYAPFLSELKKKSISFEHHLANGRRSIEALPSLLCGLPALLDAPISKSSYQGNKFTCLPKILKQSGYTNYFFHAGARGTMGFESYTLSSGFDKYFSRDEYGPKDYDGTWGIFDGPYLQYVAREISKIPEPFFVGVFTLSSHQPYTIPENLRDKFPEGTLEIHKSIGYTDYALRMFFEKIQNENWYENTIFIITADHTQKLESEKYLNLIGRYRVPLLIYTPGIESGAKFKVTQHSDIPKSALNAVGISGAGLPATSVSVFAQDEGSAINYADGSTYFLIKKNQVTTLDKSNVEKHYVYDWETGAMTPFELQNPLLKAYLQYFLNGLIKNNLSL